MSFFKKNLGYIALGVLVLFCLSVLLFARDGQGDMRAPVFPHARLTIIRADGTKIPLSIEVATTPEQDAYGLMFRRALPENAGMLFIADPPHPMVMWMKNTYIPLDMLFIRQDGVIVKIITHAVPLDLSMLESGEPVRGVIEINGGAAGKWGLKTGDRIVYPGFGANP